MVVTNVSPAKPDIQITLSHREAECLSVLLAYSGEIPADCYTSGDRVTQDEAEEVSNKLWSDLNDTL